jgi:predicted peroxiredoxin
MGMNISTKSEEDIIQKPKVEEFINSEVVKSEMQSRIEEGCKNFLDKNTLQLQNEKEDKIQESHQKILEEVELQLENVHAKYDGIISKDRVIRDQENMIEDVIVFRKKKYVMGVQNEGKPLLVKPDILTPSFPRKFSRKTRRPRSKLSRKKMKYSSIFKEYDISKSLFNNTLSKCNNYYRLEKLQQ